MRHDGRHLGTFGAAGAFSFFSNKNLAVGEGGAVVTDDDELAERMRLLRSHGMTTLTWDRHRGHAAGYDVVALGFNYRIDEPRAALATARLARLDAENAAPPRARRALPRAAGRRDGVDAHRRARRTTSSPSSLDEGIDRDAVRAALAERGIQTSLHYPPAHRFSIYADGAPELPLTDAYAARAMTLPLFATMTDAQQDLVVDALAARTLAGPLDAFGTRHTLAPSSPRPPPAGSAGERAAGLPVPDSRRRARPVSTRPPITTRTRSEQRNVDARLRMVGDAVLGCR